MVRVRVVEAEDVPRSIDASGHARLGDDGASAACASVSAALKAFGLALVNNNDCVVDGAVRESGMYHLEIGDCRDHAWLSGAWRVTRTVLLEGQRAWPDEIRIEITKEKEDGT